MPTITLSSVRKSYGSGPPVVDDLDLEIPSGSFTCLLGPSGCGKTTTLRMISGLEPLDAGTITVGGRIMDSTRDGVFVPPEKRGMGLVFQNYALWPHLTVARNVEFGLRVRKVKPAQRAERTAAALRMMQIDWAADRYPAQLSGGQQQRVSLARMLAVDPDVLLLDEPLSNLDAQLRLDMRAELKRIHDETGHTIVFVTHDQLEAMTMATHVVVMRKGAVQQMAPPMEVYSRPANTFVARFVGSPPMNIVETSEAFGATARERVLGERPRPGEALTTIGVRPEALRIVPAGLPAPPDSLVFEATVKAALPTGSSWTVLVEAGSTELYLVSYDDVRAAPGTTVRCAARVADLHLFDAAGERLPDRVDTTDVPDQAHVPDRAGATGTTDTTEENTAPWAS